MLAWAPPPLEAPKKYTISSASSASPGAWGTTNSATRMLLAAGRVCHAAGAVNVSGLAADPWSAAAAVSTASINMHVL